MFASSLLCTHRIRTHGCIKNKFMRYIRISLIAVCICLQAASAQDSTITVSGTVTDAESGELVIGAALYVASQELGATTNQYGYYSLTLLGDSVRMFVSHVAYSSQVFTFSSQEDFIFNISLEPATLCSGGSGGDSTD